MCAVVKSAENGGAIIEQRNRFKEGDELEILSPEESFGKTVTVGDMRDENGERVSDAKIVQQKLFISTDIKLCAGDILRKKTNK